MTTLMFPTEVTVVLKDNTVKICPFLSLPLSVLFWNQNCSRSLDCFDFGICLDLAFFYSPEESGQYTILSKQSDWTLSPSAIV